MVVQAVVLVTIFSMVVMAMDVSTRMSRMATSTIRTAMSMLKTSQRIIR
jgi:hypothetical protein